MFGHYCWVGTIGEFLELDRGMFKAAMIAGTLPRLPKGERPGEGQYRAWRDEFLHLRRELGQLEQKYRRLHIVFEYILPGHPDKESGKVAYCKIPDVMVFGRGGVLVLEFKQREPPPYDGFAKETRGYLRLLERWHPSVSKMSAQGALVLTKAVDFGKKYPRVRAISPDRIRAQIRKVFAEDCEPVPAPGEFLRKVGDRVKG